LHLDAAGMTLSRENLDSEFSKSLDRLRHFHVSEPDLQPIGTGDVDHALFSRILKAAKYEHWVSVEMRATGNAGNVTGVENALKVVCGYYS
jgi:sugar phosphate isomerase/epimerase